VGQQAKRVNEQLKMNNAAGMNEVRERSGNELRSGVSKF
jgi:hypothetical protein